jgi:hypothetical protein
MSDFDDMLSEGLADFLAVTGTTAFSIGAAQFAGSLDELGDQSYSVVQGGREIAVSAHLLCPIAQFGGNLPAAGTRLKIGTRAFVIAAVSSDAVSVTLTLGDPDAT